MTRWSTGRNALTVVVLAALAGCASPATVSTVPTRGATIASPTTAALERPSGIAPSPIASPSRAPRPLWATESLTDVRSGATLRLADLDGSLVLIEAMATWCPPCVTQQSQAQAALAGLSGRKVVYVSLDIDPREGAETVARYADDHAFPWRFFVASQTLLRSLARTFGEAVLSPPTTPIIVIRRDGSAYLTETGIKSAARLTEIIRADT